MNADNKVRTEPPHQEVGSPPVEPAPNPNVSPAVNGAADDQQHHQSKEPAENELVTNQMYEPHLITDQQSEPIEPPKNSEKSDVNSQAAEDTEDPRPIKTYGKAIERNAPSIVEDQLNFEKERIQKIPGFSCSYQQTLAVPGTDNFYLTVTLFTIKEGVSTSKLVKSKERGSRCFSMYGKVEDDDLLKPGEYMEIGVYQDVNYRQVGSCHYKYIHSFLVPSP